MTDAAAPHPPVEEATAALEALRPGWRLTPPSWPSAAGTLVWALGLGRLGVEVRYFPGLDAEDGPWDVSIDQEVPAAECGTLPELLGALPAVLAAAHLLEGRPLAGEEDVRRLDGVMAVLRWAGRRPSCARRLAQILLESASGAGADAWADA